MDFKEIASTNRISIKRAVARFCYLKNIPLSKEEFHILVRRTQDSGYRSAIKFFPAISAIILPIRKNNCCTSLPSSTTRKWSIAANFLKGTKS